MDLAIANLGAARVVDRSALLAHDIPHRFRFEIPSLKASARGDTLGAYIEALDGVINTRVRPLTGSLIVEHDGKAATRARVFVALVELGYRVDTRRTSQRGAAVQPLQDATVTGAMARTIVRVLVEEAFRFAILALI